MRRIAAFIIMLASLVALSPLSTAAEGENLVTNGDISSITDGIAEGWHTDAWESEQGYTEFGTSTEGRDEYCLIIDNLEENDARYVQSVSVKPLTTYKLSGYIKALSVEGTWGANLSIGNTFTATAGVFDTAGQWQYVELVGTTVKGQSTLDIYLRVGYYGDTVKGRALFDDISLVECEDDGTAVSFATTSSQASNNNSGGTQAEQSGNYFPLMVLLCIGWAVLVYAVYARMKLKSRKTDVISLGIAVIGAAVLVRVMLAVMINGYPNDIACFRAWAEQAVSSNLVNIYKDSSFLDYPPGYMYILYFVGWINRAFALTGVDALQVLGVKLPSIIADVICACVLFRFARKSMGDTKAALISLLYLFNPMVILDSSAWGQIDSVLTLFMVISFISLYEHKHTKSAVFFALGLLLKPQMFLLAPLMLFALIVECRNAEDGRTRLIICAKMFGFGLLTLVAGLLPFWVTQSPEWPLKLYFGTMGSYQYGAVNACNLASLFGGNWVSSAQTVFGLSYSAWGYIGVVLTLGFIFWRYVIHDRSHKNLFLYAALMLAGIFTLSHMMHERYMYPALMFLLLAFTCTKDKRLLLFFGGFSVTQFLNCALTLEKQYMGYDSLSLGVLRIANPLGEGAATFWISLAVVLLLAWFVYITLTLGKQNAAFIISPEEDPPKEHKLEKRENRLRFTRKDWLLMGILTAVYAVVAVVYLGTTKVPQSMWVADKSDGYVVLDLGEEREIGQIRHYYGLSKGEMRVEAAGEDGEWKEVAYWNGSESTSLYVWDIDSLEVATTARYLRLTCVKPTMRILEVAVYDPSGNMLSIDKVSDTNVKYTEGAKLFDEQDRVPTQRNFLNSTYFDEVYHARTAWEFTEGIKAYENTHPPLGKVIISWGIQIFGMNPFGWRIAGTVFGILMVPLMYLFGMVLFKKTRYAFILSFLFTFDFMHFSQTRIATIDTYSTFFIIGMYIFMFMYMERNFNNQPLIKTLWPLALCGVMFALGAASKWTCLYAGVGLAVLFFYTFIKRCVEYARVRAGSIALDEEEKEYVLKRFPRNVLLTALWCVLFFLRIPAAIYLLSYIPYVRGMGEGAGNTFKDYIRIVWDNQLSMYRYHTGLVDDHFFQSPWYQWPFNYKPIWLYKNYDLPAGMMGSIASFGNPLVWLCGTAAIIASAFAAVKPGKDYRLPGFLLAAFLIQYLPWVLVPRSMFIYHYFNSVPFFTAMIVMFIMYMEESGRLKKKHTYIYMAAVLLLFILFYPVLSGLPVSSVYGRLLRWLPTWYFTY